jgi:hypothetical protein
MPHFFFHLYDETISPDECGCSFADIAEAVAFAEESARELAGEEVRRGTLHLDHWIEIADARGEVLRVVPFRSAFTVTT